MARIKGAKNVSTLIAEGKLPPEAVGWSRERRQQYMDGNIELAKTETDERTDDEILENIRNRFSIYQKMVTAAATDSMIRSAIFSGSPGVGKTYIAATVLEQRKLRNPDFRYFHVKGTISALDLYELGYNFRHPGNVILLDDSDRIIYDDEGMNILKAMLDSSENRVVTWMTNHQKFSGEGELPKTYTFHGSIIFISNINFEKEVELGRFKNLEHLEALLDRSIYLDLAIHDRRAVMLWVRHIVRRAKMLQNIGLTEKEEQDVMVWLMDNSDRLKELSLRTPLKIGQMMLMGQSNNPEVRVDWKMMAEMTMLRRTF